MKRFERLNRPGVPGLAAMILAGCGQMQHPSGAPDVRTKAVVDFSSCDKPKYPYSRYAQEGTVTMEFLINADGKVAESKILRSSGFRELDRAAVVGISKCQFKPATLNGVPETSWMQMQHVWQVEY